MCRRVTTAIAVVAALAFVIDGALGGSHLVSAASAHGGHIHAHAHSHAHVHGPAVAADQQLVGGDVAVDVDVTDQRGPLSAPDADANGCTCVCTCSAAALQPSVNFQAVPFLLIRDIAFVQRRYGDGIVPEGLRRPPRPLSIA